MSIKGRFIYAKQFHRMAYRYHIFLVFLVIAAVRIIRVAIVVVAAAAAGHATLSKFAMMYVDVLLATGGRSLARTYLSLALSVKV
jgi:hypothetical protein